LSSTVTAVLYEIRKWRTPLLGRREIEPTYYTFALFTSLSRFAHWSENWKRGYTISPLQFSQVAI
jgi:hypothetical protein